MQYNSDNQTPYSLIQNSNEDDSIPTEKESILHERGIIVHQGDDESEDGSEQSKLDIS